MPPQPAALRTLGDGARALLEQVRRNSIREMTNAAAVLTPEQRERAWLLVRTDREQWGRIFGSLNGWSERVASVHEGGRRT
jgi:hypothetical protein